MRSYETDAHPKLIHYLFALLLSGLLWVLLVGTLDPQELVLGLAVSLIVTFIAAPQLSVFTGLRLTPHAPIALLQYLGHFVVALIRANLDVARRVLAPSLPIRPALIEIETELQSALGRLLLANSITLTPGTLVVDVSGDRLFVHWIDCPPDIDLAEATRRIASDFERHIKGFLR